MRRLLVLLSGCFLLTAGLSWASTIYVKPDGTGDAPTIGAAMDSAAVGDTLVLASGTFTGEGNRDLTVPDKNLRIISETGNPNDCVIDCEGAGCFRFEDCTAVVEGLTITNTLSSGLYLDSQQTGFITLAVKNCNFTSCGCGGWGGAIYMYCDGEVSVSGCSFLSNIAYQGGAVYRAALGYLRVWIDGCTFCGNSAAGSGGAIYIGGDEGGISIRNSVFCHNSATSDGGAVATGEVLARMTGCTFFANSAPVGSAIAVGLYADIDRCILAHGTGGSAMYWWEPTWFDPNYLTCTDIYGNEGGDWVGVIADQLGQNGNFSACPSFCSYEIEPYDLHLCSSSPCLPGNHPDGVSCGLIGALGQGCGCGPSGIEPTTWGAIKAMHK